MRDIESQKDIEQLMRRFYGDLLQIPGMDRVFAGINMEEHLPRIVHFWSFVLLDEDGYKTNVFERHLHLPIKPEQFNQWLQTFTTAVDTLFKGERAELAKLRATTLAYTFENKWRKLGK